MADIRINALTTTATSSASDDFIAIDGAANGTRKLSIFNPAIGGTLDVTGNITGTVATMTRTGADGTLNVVRSGGSSATFASGTTNSYLGTSTNHPLVLYTNGTTALTLSTSQNTTLAGNLTVSGTGTSSVAGKLGIGDTSGVSKLAVLDTLPFTTVIGSSSGQFGYQIKAGASDTAGTLVGGLTYDSSTGEARLIAAQSYVFPTFYSGGSEAARFTTSRNFLLGTTTDSANGKLQLAAGAADKTSGIGFGTDTSLFRQGAGLVQLVGVGTGGWPTLKISDDASSSASFQTGVLAFGDGNSTARNVGIWRGAANSIVTVGNVLNLGGYAGITFTTGAAQIGSQTTALTLDSSQNATFAGNYARINSASDAYFVANGNAAGSSASYQFWKAGSQKWNLTSAATTNDLSFYNNGGINANALTLEYSTGNATFAGKIAINNTVTSAVSVASTHKVTISIGGVTYYLLASNV